MIARYSLPRMSNIWSEKNRFAKMLDVELFACEAQAKLGKMPKEALSRIRRYARFDVERIKKLEEKTNHDVIAFLQNLAENIGDDAKYVHMGLTSSDILDTALSVQMREASDVLIYDAKRLLVAFKRKARQYKMTPMIGRTHSVHAEPITFGLKMALYYDEMNRNLDRLKRAREIISVGKISGAVGTYATVEPLVEERVCGRLKLKPARASNQILQRDRHAEFLTTIAIVGTSLEKFATEFRNLQHTEIGEIEEFFAPDQKGSSAMPHKRNPIMCERICGLARILRSNALAAMEDIVLWHERDISHSSTERVIIPDSTILLDYMLEKFTDVVMKLGVRPNAMLENLNRSKGAIFSQRILLALLEKGFMRDEAYEKVQALAFAAKDKGIDFARALLEDGEVASLFSREEIEGLFDIKYYLRHVSRIFRKLGI